MWLAKLLSNNWEENQKISTFLASIDQKDVPNMSLDPLCILTTSLYKATFIDLNNFIFITQLDVEKPEIYKEAMNCPYA